jgi:hypothetical protein
MKKPFVALLLLVGVAAMVASTAFAQQDDPNGPGFKLFDAKMVKDMVNSRALKTAVSAGPDPDTVYLGHSYQDHFNASNNWWNVWVGDFQPGVTSDPNNAVWDWDHTTGLSNHGINDSLAGWWPTRMLYNVQGGLTLPDVSRPWWAIDIGNDANYVINQGAGGKRTKGVVGIWHADPGVGGGHGVLWSPLSGSHSAWCGLRQHGDNTVVDQVTLNGFNASVTEFSQFGSPTTPTTKSLPGYISQMDQMLYRDLTPPAATTLNISFLYRTRMSTGFDNTAATRTGWFHGDPLAVTTGNFISSTDAGVNAPIDSFQVYIGVPVNDAACTYSDGVVRPVYDKQRRWFSEILRINEGSSVPYYEIFSTAGSVPADTAAATPTKSVAIPGANVDLIRNATGNTSHIVRLVFRVKTNRGFDDSDGGGGFTSTSRGAAIIDDVIVNGTNIGDFETAEQGGVNSIDNRTGASALNNWKSTGKPPSIYFHPRNVTTGELSYNDLCGDWNAPSRQCNINGNVIVAGNFDENEVSGSKLYTVDREFQQGLCSPTINFVSDPITNAPNSQGVTASMVNVTDDYYFWYTMYAGMFNLSFSGNAWAFACQAYPATQRLNGGKCWGDMILASFIFFNPEPQCFEDVEPLNGNGILGTSGAGGVPDSVRIYMYHVQECFRFAVSLGCNSSDGAYFDNLSFAFVDQPASGQVSSSNTYSVGTATASIWQFWNDAFPANETPGLPGTAAYDTCGALLKSGLNNAPSTGNELRFDVPGDTLSVIGGFVTGSTDTVLGNQTRMDIVFRILPGPGNYQAGPGRTFPPVQAMNLLQLPSNQSGVVTAGDASFWGQYISDPGTFSKGNHHGNVWWDYLTWNSARLDTTERNIFPVAGKITTSRFGTSGVGWMTTYHESDPKFNTLGYNKFRCFMVDTAGSATQTNIICDGTVPVYLTTVPQSRTGYDGSNVTKEFSKIIPDGLLTPGAHVQYFFRKSGLAFPTITATCPDTTRITSQAGESNTDGHRWQQFGVLPDRWKDPAFGGAGMASMLYIDLDDRRGEERVFVSEMDSLGGTAQTKWGAHNGWHAIGGPGAVPNSSTLTIADPRVTSYPNKNQQPGTTWDMYGTKASESLATTACTIGDRYANRASMGLLTGKQSRVGPTKEALRAYYRIIALNPGDLDTGGILGPYTNRSQNDIDILNDYLVTPVGGAGQPRGIYVTSDGFAFSEVQAGAIDPSHLTFMSTKLGITFRANSYQFVSGNQNNCADLLTTNLITTNHDIYGVANTCLWSNDLINRNPAITEATEAMFYENTGVNGPYTASVYKPSSGTRPWIAYTDAWDQRHTLSRYCDSNLGRLAYAYNSINNVFAAIGSPLGQPISTLGVPQNQHGAQFVNFMKVGNSLMRSGNARIHFGLANSDRVKIRMYDVTGRLVRTLADRSFNAGEYDLAWDGTDDSGNQVARGVYFARIEYAARGVGINGRVVVLR